jgi:hypothetical protein
MPSLTVVISGTSQPLQRELRLVERMAKETGANIQRGLEGGAGGGARAGAMRETLVLMREISRGNWSRVPGSLTILLDRLGLLKFVVKENVSAAQLLADAHQKESQAAALAALASTRKAAASQAALYAESGETEANLAAAVSDEEKAAADITAAQSARVKAVASGEAAAAMEAEAGAATFALGPLGWIAAALIAVGTAAYFTVRHFRAVNEETRNLRELVDGGTIAFNEQADALRSAAEAAEDFYTWLGKLESKQGSLAETTDDAIKAMREQFQLKERLAQAQGVSKADIAKQEIDEAKSELDVLTAAKAKAAQELANAKVQGQEAANEAKDFDNDAAVKDAIKRREEAEKVVAQIQAQKASGKTITEFHTGGLGSPAVSATSRPMTDSDRVGGLKAGGKDLPAMSLNEARANLEKISAEAGNLENSQKGRTNAVKESRDQIEKAQRDYDKLTKQQSDAQNQLSLKQKYLPQIAAEGQGGTQTRFTHGFLNASQRIGAYAPPAAQVTEHKETNKKLSEIGKTLTKIEENTGRHGSRRGALWGGGF